jgi:ATPase subunit of ABC transporter with duplicated ATPase domains
VLEVARQAGLVGRKRVLDSTALYDAVAIQDTVTMIRASIRSLLRVPPEGLRAELRGALKRQNHYASAGTPACDWEDAAAREALVNGPARDVRAVLEVQDGKTVAEAVREAGELVATVVGQDMENRDDGVFVIARRVSPNRVISTVDPEARHGHKTAARGFDGCKGHLAIDPDSEVVVVYDGFDFLVRRGERWCVMGRNGAGKSTLLKMVAGALTPDSGDVKLGASLKLGYFAQQSLDLLDPALTVIEQLQKDFPVEGLGVLRNLAGAFQFSGDDVDKPVRVLSGGEKSRLVLARMLFVSHDETFLRGLANRVLEIGGEDGTGKPVTYGGTYEEYVARSGHEAPGVHA